MSVKTKKKKNYFLLLGFGTQKQQQPTNKRGIGNVVTVFVVKIRSRSRLGKGVYCRIRLEVTYFDYNYPDETECTPGPREKRRL